MIKFEEVVEPILREVEVVDNGRSFYWAVNAKSLRKMPRKLGGHKTSEKQCAPMPRNNFKQNRWVLSEYMIDEPIETLPDNVARHRRLGKVIKECKLKINYGGLAREPTDWLAKAKLWVYSKKRNLKESRLSPINCSY